MGGRGFGRAGLWASGRSDFGPKWLRAEVALSQGGLGSKLLLGRSAWAAVLGPQSPGRSAWASVPGPQCLGRSAGLQLQRLRRFLRFLKFLISQVSEVIEGSEISQLPQASEVGF